MWADNESMIHLRRFQIQFSTPGSTSAVRRLPVTGHLATAFKVFYRIPDKVNNSSSVSPYALQGKLFELASSCNPAMAESWNV